MRPVEPVIDAGAQVQQQINVECIEDFQDLPTILVQFMNNGVQQRLSLKLPVSINKFMEQTVMNSENFFARWKNLNKSVFHFFSKFLNSKLSIRLIDCSPAQEAQKIFKARFGMDPEVTKTKLIGFGFQLLESVDPNPENFVCAGIVHTRNVQVGCLLRLEPNKQAQVCYINTKSNTVYL